MTHRAVVTLGALLLAVCGEALKPDGQELPIPLFENGAVDVTAPTLTALGFSPTAVNTETGSVPVTVSYTVSAEVCRAGKVCLQRSRPSGSHSSEGVCDVFAAATSHSGSVDVRVPQFVEPGIWKLQAYALGDAVGNGRVYSPSDLAAASFPTDLDVTSVPDNTPPTLTALSFSPTAINTETGSATVAVSYSVSDDLAGFGTICAQFVPPSGSGFGQCDGASAATSHSGSITFTFPQFGEVGTWKLDIFHLRDVVGNAHSYSTADLAAAGSPIDLFVGVRHVTIDIKPGENPNVIMKGDSSNIKVRLLLESAKFPASLEAPVPCAR